MTCDLEAACTALAACLIAAGNTRAWWYSINDTNSETPLHELLRTTESHLIQLLLDIKLLSVHNRFKSLSISKNVVLLVCFKSSRHLDRTSGSLPFPP